MRKHVSWLVAAALAAALASGESLPLGQIIDEVQCAADVSQHYSLYLPSNFSPQRRWPVILAYDAGGRGRRAVERYKDAAEKYGYIVAGSNNSRNGPWEISLNAAKAMTGDVDKLFPVDPKRIYTAGAFARPRVARQITAEAHTIADVCCARDGWLDVCLACRRVSIFVLCG